VVFNIFFDQVQKFLGYSFSAQGYMFFAVNEHGGSGSFAGTGKADADVSMTAFARAIDDTSNDRQGQVFRAFILQFPLRHAAAYKLLYVLGQ
jgi:hypothetical protein